MNTKKFAKMFGLQEKDLQWGFVLETNPQVIKPGVINPCLRVEGTNDYIDINKMEISSFCDLHNVKREFIKAREAESSEGWIKLQLVEELNDYPAGAEFSFDVRALEINTSKRWYPFYAKHFR